MYYVVIWSEDDGDCSYNHYEIFTNIADVIDFIAGIEVDWDCAVDTLFQSDTEIKEINFPNIPPRLVKIKEKEKEIREKKEEEERHAKWEMENENRDKKEYKRLKKKYEKGNTQ